MSQLKTPKPSVGMLPDSQPSYEIWPQVSQTGGQQYADVHIGTQANPQPTFTSPNRPIHSSMRCCNPSTNVTDCGLPSFRQRSCIVGTQASRIVSRDLPNSWVLQACPASAELSAYMWQLIHCHADSGVPLQSNKLHVPNPHLADCHSGPFHAPTTPLAFFPPKKTLPLTYALAYNLVLCSRPGHEHWVHCCVVVLLSIHSEAM